ncbi:hypothetical protein M9H77_12263 [Catharanthus roseus]|uniref:Uncharacterized protein n=1 Tax=Catharanthus roseus TaxID=4058 RepID=A0ACC0BGU8_CATRO|nr:hypothetical protein M9H77_12263 [Catharanthus roseus]
MVGYMENALKNKLEEFEDLGKASKLFSILLEKSNPTVDGSHTPTIAGRLLSGISWKSTPYHVRFDNVYGRRGGLGGRGHYRPQEEFPRHEAWHEDNMYEDYGDNPNVS